MGDRAKLVLYRLKADWGVPSSLSIACLQVEAYLRLAQVQFAVQDCAWSSFSPTGQVPALDFENGDLISCTSDSSDTLARELEGAKTIIAHLQRQPATNLDAALSPADRAEILAFTTLIDTKLVPALLYSTWCESDAFFKLTRPAIGAGFPFPLNYWVPLAARRDVRAHLGNTTAEEIYEAARSALDAISSKLVQAATTDGFILGDKPSTLDATVFACLAYLRSAPVVHPDLRRKFESHSVLGRYVDRVAEKVFSVAVPTAAQAKMHWTPWSSSTGGSSSGGASSKRKVFFNLDINKKGKMWLIGAAAATLGYILLSGQYFEIGFSGDLGEDDDGEE